MNHYVNVYEEIIATFDILAITKLNSVRNANGELSVEWIFLHTFGQRYIEFHTKQNFTFA